MKLNPFDHYEDKETRNLQIIYLDNILKIAREKIAEITGLAISTIKKYCNKFLDLLDKAKRLFNNGLEKARLSKLDEKIRWEVEPTEKPCGYCIEFYNGKKLLWLKVGMTERPIRQRIKEHFAYYSKKGFENLNCVVKKLYEVNSHEMAEIIESALREVYKKNHEDCFIKNDRFKGIAYTGEEQQDERFLSFLALAQAI